MAMAVSGDELRGVARLARESVVVGRAVMLARWIGTGRRPVTAGQVLRKADVPAAGAALGVDVPPRLRTMADIRALHRPWCVAVATGLLQVGGGWVTGGPALEGWPPGDADLLAGWLAGLRAVCAAESYPQDEDSVRLLVMALLTVLGQDGVPRNAGLWGPVHAALRDLCDRYDKSSWEPLHAADRYYDLETGTPLAGLVALLAEFGAVTGDPGKPSDHPAGPLGGRAPGGACPAWRPGPGRGRDDRRSRPVQRRGTAGPCRVGMAGRTRSRRGGTGDPGRRRGDVAAAAQRGRRCGGKAGRGRAACLAGDERHPCGPARPRRAGRLGPGSRTQRRPTGSGWRWRPPRPRWRTRGPTRRSPASGRACRGGPGRPPRGGAVPSSGCRGAVAGGGGVRRLRRAAQHRPGGRAEGLAISCPARRSGGVCGCRSPPPWPICTR